MEQRDGRLYLSPSDLNGFLACEHRTALDLARARGELQLERIPRPDAELIAERGREHEAAYLAGLEYEGYDVVRIARDTSIGAAALATEEAMRTGREVIYQAAFQGGNWRGVADFLLRVDTPSDLGEFSYEPADAKLATHPRPYVVFQLLFYADMLAALQGLHPAHVHVILGDEQVRSLRPRDFAAYAERVQRRFLTTLRTYSKGAEPPYPYPVEHCAHCDWWARCRDRRRDDDHLSLVAFLTRTQAERLEATGTRTVAELAALGEEVTVPRIGSGTLGGLRAQARLQVASRGLPQPVFERRAPEPGRGFALLPEPSSGDVFFDIEGDPYWSPEGLEYLFGSLTADGHGALWAHDREQERAIFERWVDWISVRLEVHPDLHIYHYNHYEPTAIKTLMARYGSREREVDDMLRRKVFVDLYTVVRQALRIGTESYSLKAVEALYPLERDAAVTDAGGSILAYQQWLETGDDATLRAIAAYNADDCASTRGLRDWLLAERGDAVAPPPPPARQPGDAARARMDEVARVVADLTAGGADEDHLRLADVLEYHRREARPQWWAYFERLGRSPAELRDEDPEAIGGLEAAEDLPLEEVAQSYLHPLRFPPQQHKIAPGVAVDPATEKGVVVDRVDDAAGVLWVRRGKPSRDKPLPHALVPPRPIPQDAQQAALLALGARVAERGIGHDAACALLQRRPPALRAESLSEQVAGLGPGALFVQGPPGSGKTHTGAGVIADLLGMGVRVGVAATSHKAIANLLDAVERAATDRGVDFRGLKKAGSAAPETRYDSAHIDSATGNDAFPPPRDVGLIAGTPWLWARAEMAGSVDVLVVDEAGQVSLADALAIAGAARTVVLLGDPQQLAHVSQGTHPRGSGVSVLEHLLGERETVSPGEGVFLATTHRMHPDVCRFVSRTMYDGRLESEPGLERQRVSAGGVSAAGVRLIEVEHDGDRVSSPEEAEAIAREIDALLDGGTFTGRDGAERPLTLQDVLVVAPFNAQVRALRERLPEGARVGTVDRFQGQQAPVVFFSMTSSSGEDVPRGMDFLFSRNRLNVAVSRAQALAVVVCSPRLLWARCATIEQMRLVNALCEFAEEAERQAAASAPAAAS